MMAVVTGAGSGIGRACALTLAERKTTVLCVGRRLALLEETCAVIDAAGGKAIPCSGDVATTRGVATVRDAVREPVSALVHAAGQELVAPFGDTDPDKFREVFAVNVGASFFLTQALIPALTTGAGIVFVSSIAALAGREWHAAYGASKAALIGLTKNLAVELAPGVRVNCVIPGATVTAMLEHAIQEYASRMSAQQLQSALVAESTRMLLGRTAEPVEVARTIVHIALDATAMTGSVVPVDLGYTAR